MEVNITYCVNDNVSEESPPKETDMAPHHRELSDDPRL